MVPDVGLTENIELLLDDILLIVSVAEPVFVMINVSLVFELTILLPKLIVFLFNVISKTYEK